MILMDDINFHRITNPLAVHRKFDFFAVHGAKNFAPFPNQPGKNLNPEITLVEITRFHVCPFLRGYTAPPGFVWYYAPTRFMFSRIVASFSLKYSSTAATASFIDSRIAEKM